MDQSPQADSFVPGLRGHVECDQAVDGPSHGQRHGGAVQHLVGKAALQVDGHAISLLEKLLQFWNFVLPRILISCRSGGQFGWRGKYDRWCFRGDRL